MGYYVGQFYVSKRDVFLVLGILLLGLLIYLNYPIPYFDTKQLATLFILAFFAKGLLLPTHDSVVFMTFFIGVLLTLFVPFLEVILFLFLAFLFLRVLKVI